MQNEGSGDQTGCDGWFQQTFGLKMYSFTFISSSESVLLILGFLADHRTESYTLTAFETQCRAGRSAACGVRSPAVFCPVRLRHLAGSVRMLRRTRECFKTSLALRFFFNLQMHSVSLSLADLLPLIRDFSLPSTCHRSESSWSLLLTAVGYVSRWAE